MPERDDGAEYSIKAAAQATGLTVETLRAWERRYRVLEPKRDSSGHRIYTACNLSRLRRLRETIDRGHQISKIAHLSDEQLCCLLSEPEEAHPTEADAAQVLVARILCAVDQYRAPECDQAVAMAFALLPATEVMRDVLGPALREVGERWHRGELTVGQERIASGAARRQLSSLLKTFLSFAQGPSVVFATLSGEQHEIGILMHAALAASRMLRTHYLGPDMPPEEIGNFARRVKASAVAISLVMPAAVEGALRQLGVLRRSLPANVEIWIGGGAARAVDPAELPAGSIYMADSGDFDERVRLLMQSA